MTVILVNYHGEILQTVPLGRKEITSGIFVVWKGSKRCRRGTFIHLTGNYLTKALPFKDVEIDNANPR